MHALPHEPQLALLVLVSTHANPVPLTQLVVPLGHVFAHPPPAHASVAKHALPQSPQLAGSEVVDTHRVPQRLVPGRHSQAPALHISASLQVLPHAPQFVGSIATSVQAPPQSFPEAGQLHAPPTHAGVPPPQVLPQAPQLSGSVLVSTHLPPHSLPVGHAQTPDTHVPAAPQGFPQAPQLAGSVETSLQEPAQFTIVAGHAPHLPATHASVAPHAVPQVPQFFGSFARSTQVPPHLSGQGAPSLEMPSPEPSVLPSVAASVAGGSAGNVAVPPHAPIVANRTSEHAEAKRIAESMEASSGGPIARIIDSHSVAVTAGAVSTRALLWDCATRVRLWATRTSRSLDAAFGSAKMPDRAGGVGQEGLVAREGGDDGPGV